MICRKSSLVYVHTHTHTHTHLQRFWKQLKIWPILDVFSFVLLSIIVTDSGCVCVCVGGGGVSEEALNNGGRTLQHKGCESDGSLPVHSHTVLANVFAQLHTVQKPVCVGVIGHGQRRWYKINKEQSMAKDNIEYIDGSNYSTNFSNYTASFLLMHVCACLK